MWIALLLACNPGPPDLEHTERVVVVGDNVGSNPSWSSSFVGLLEQNDDALFPEWEGRDLATAAPDAVVLRLVRGGDSYDARADAEPPLCTCDGDCPPDCVDTSDDRPTVVIVELGVNDLVATALAALNDAELQADPSDAVDAFRSDVAAVLDAATDPLVFARPPRLLVTNVYDPSDGVGDVAALVTSFFPFPGAEQVTPEMALAVIEGFNDAITVETEARGGAVVDLHGAFLGHGYHSDDALAPHHDPLDPTRWYATVIDPNLRGAHEIRREVWAALAGERIDVLPGPLPVAGTAGLPTVPDAGWADAVVSSDVTASLVDGDTTYPNLADDPQEALGSPQGGTGDMVALGVLGAYVVLDLGAVHDGEGDDLVVLEMGPASGGTPEPYRVSVSVGADGPWTTLADAMAERSFDLGAAGLSEVRYVRLESLATQAEVLGGVGSPFYPGPEIDAVGAVYP